MKNNHKVKLIAASLAFSASLSAMGGLGGLNVQSNLGEPFAGSVTVTGEEAQILLNGGSASLSNNNLQTSVRKSGDNAVISIRSNAPVNDPVLVFQIGVGAQSRQYTAIIDPPDYSVAQNSSNTNRVKTVAENQTGYFVQEQRGSSVQKNTTQEQTRAARQKSVSQTLANKRNIRTAETTSHNQSKIAQGDYTIRNGETLTSIAARVRPSGLSIHDTINALVAANPKLFPTQNPDFINAGKVLNIPSAQELRQLAQQSNSVDVTESVSSEQEQQEQIAQTVSASAEMGESGQAPANQLTTAASETIVETSEAAIASEPVVSASDIPETASEVISEVAEESVSGPVESSIDKEQTQQTEQTVSSSSEDSSWWRWLLYAGLAAIVLWLLLKVIGKKKQASDTVLVDDGNDDIVLDGDIAQDSNIFTDITPSHDTDMLQNDSAVSMGNAESAIKASAASAIASQKTDDTLNIEDDFDDDIFFTETKVVPVEKTDQDFNLDLGAIDKEQGAIVSSSLTQDEETQKRQNADWDAIESTESVYEPEPESEYQHVAVEFNAPTNEEVVSAVEVKSDIDVTATGFVESSKSESSGLKPLVEEVQKPVEFEQPDTNVRNKDSSLEAGISTAAKDDDNALEFEVVSEPLSENKSAHAASHEEGNAATSLDFDIAETPVESDAAFGTNLEKADVQNQSVEKANLVSSSQNDVHTAKDDFSWSLDQQEEGISFQDTEDLSKPIELATADDTETIEWESISVAEESGQSDGGFISESVGMTAPLEAKYELAQMYIEIGDPDAARETLQELLEESSGEILEKTKAMLAELNK